MVEVRATGGGVLSSFDPNGFKLLIVEQPARPLNRAIAVIFRPVRVRLLTQFLSEDMIDGCSIIVVSVCPGAAVAIICRVDAVRAAKRVTIPAQNGSDSPNITRHCPLSYPIKSKI